MGSICSPSFYFIFIISYASMADLNHLFPQVSSRVCFHGKGLTRTPPLWKLQPLHEALYVKHVSFGRKRMNGFHRGLEDFHPYPQWQKQYCNSIPEVPKIQTKQITIYSYNAYDSCALPSISNEPKNLTSSLFVNTVVNLHSNEHVKLVTTEQETEN